MILRLKRIESVLLGMLLLSSATSMYLVLGETGKFLSLVFGLLFVVVGSISIRHFGKLHNTVLLMSLIYIIYIFQSFLLSQPTTSFQSIIFSLVNLILFISGFSLSKAINLTTPRHVFVFGMMIFVILNAIVYLKYRTSYATMNSINRVVDEYLNPIGIAYYHSVILLMVFSLSIAIAGKYIRALCYLIMSVELIVILSTLSRGPLLYVISVILLFVVGSIFRRGLTIRTLGRILSGLVFLSIAFNILLGYSVQLSLLWESFMDRFMLIFDYLLGNVEERSIDERSNYFKVVFENWQEMLFGYSNYKPYPHNFFLETYMRFGILALPLMLRSITLFIVTLISIRRFSYSKDIWLLIFPLIFLYTFLQSMTSMSLENNRFLWLSAGYMSSLDVHILKRYVK